MPTAHETVAALRQQGHNCAQTVFAYALERCGLDPAPFMPTLRGMGSGLSCGHNCGCVVGGVCALGSLVQPQGGAVAYKQVRSLSKQFVSWFEGEFGSVECAVLKRPAGGAQAVPCDELIEKSCLKMDVMAKEIGVLPAK